jgi:hypothetical protein
MGASFHSLLLVIRRAVVIRQFFQGVAGVLPMLQI